MHPFGQSLSHLDSKSMEIEVIGVLIGFEKLLGKAGGAFAHGYGLHRQHIGWQRRAIGCDCEISVEISDAIAVA